jgi:hypothetical protein
MSQLSPYLIYCTKFDSDRLAKFGAVKPHFMSSLFFAGFFDQATGQTVQSIVMVDGSSDMFLHKEVLFMGITWRCNPNWGLNSLKTPFLGPFFDTTKSRGDD